MDPPIHALKFSEDLLIQILMRHNAIKSADEFGFLRDLDMFQKQRCPMPVVEAVLGLMEHRKERIQASFDELCNIKVFNINDFRFELSITAIMYFQEGYNHFKFLNYCALLGGLSVRYIKAGHREIPTGCSQLLAYFLNFWMYSMVFNPNSDYFELACVAQRVRRNLLLIKRNKDVNVADGVSEEVKDTTRKVPEKGEESLKMPKKGDEVSSEKKHGKEDQKKTDKQLAEEMTKAVINVIDKGKGGKNTPKKKGSKKLPETQQEGEIVPEKVPGNDGVPEMPKFKRPQKVRRGGKK